MEALAQAVAEDRAAGYNPVAICANAGTASTGAVDPLEAMADYCAEEGIWLHVDAAYGGFAVLTERGKRLLAGIEHADSIGVDAHKLLFQPYEAGCLLVKDLRTLEAAFRRAVGNGMDLAVRAEHYVRASAVLEIVSAASLGIVCLRVNPGNSGLDEQDLKEINGNVLAQVFWDDPAFISSTSLHGKFSLRLRIVNHNTTWDDVRETLEAVERFGRAALGDRGI